MVKELYYSNGDRLECEWVNSKVHGKGIWYLDNGDRFEITYKGGISIDEGIMLMVIKLNVWEQYLPNGKCINYLSCGVLKGNLRMEKRMVNANGNTLLSDAIIKDGLEIDIKPHEVGV